MCLCACPHSYKIPCVGAVFTQELLHPMLGAAKLRDKPRCPQESVTCSLLIELVFWVNEEGLHFSVSELQPERRSIFSHAESQDCISSTESNLKLSLDNFRFKNACTLLLPALSNNTWGCRYSCFILKVNNMSDNKCDCVHYWPVSCHII